MQTPTKQTETEHTSISTIDDVQMSTPSFTVEDGDHRPKRFHNGTMGDSQSRTPARERKLNKKNILDAYPYSSASDVSKRIITQLKSVYKLKVKPIESKFDLYSFCLPTNAPMQESEFDAKPMVLLVGQYSTGKTTFIRHLVGGDFPSMHIGPEPTTDRFMALIHGQGEEFDEEDLYDESFNSYSDKIINSPSTKNSGNILTEAWKKDGKNTSTGAVVKGNSLTVMPELPFASLSTFGSGFLSHFVGSITPAPLLEHVTLIDTPGVLSGEKQRLSRSYDFAKASKWFADRSDLILLLFDAHKLDISDELKDVIETIRPHNDDKIRCVLNKADGVTREQLVRVYGSLMWSMGKIFKTPEVVRVYAGSYWDEPLVHDDFESMFESDEWLLINELVNLPRSCAERKVNEVVKRIRMIKVHICLLSHLKQQMPRWFGKKKAQEDLINNLKEVFITVRLEYKLSTGDFPDIKEFTKCLNDVEDFASFPIADSKTLKLLDDLIDNEIPKIMEGAVGVTGSGETPSKHRKRTPMRPKSRSSDSGDTSSSNSVNDDKEGTSLVDEKASMPPKQRAAPIYWILFIGIPLMYAALCYCVLLDVDNSMGLPPALVEHCIQAVSFFQTHVYDMRDFSIGLLK